MRRGPARRWLAGLGVLAALLTGSVPGASAALRSRAAPTVQPPADEAPHHDAVEWWYFNGHLRGRTPTGAMRSYGYEDVTFQFLFGGRPLYFSDLAVTDLNRHSFHYGERSASHAVPNEKNSFSLTTGGWTMRGAGGADALAAAIPGYRLDLRLATLEAPALHGQNGVVDLGPFGHPNYYSFTDLATIGSLVDHGVRVKVSGRSWMDHEWGALNMFSGAGWDWFSVQLTNGQQYMLSFVRDRSGKIVTAFGTKVDARHSTVLARAGLADQPTGSWHSSRTGITYGSGWHLRVPGGALTVTPDLLDQEVAATSLQGATYWEGDSAVSGVIDGKAVHGVGYTEINPPGQL